MKVINVQEAKTHLSRLLETAASGEEVILGKHGRPMAKLSAYQPANEPRKLGGFEGRVEIAADFDAGDSRVQALFDGD